MAAIANKPALTREKPKAERDAGSRVLFAEAVSVVLMFGRERRAFTYVELNKPVTLHLTAGVVTRQTSSRC